MRGDQLPHRVCSASLSLGEREDLQSSTPEEYLDGRVLAHEARLRDGVLAVEVHGRVARQRRVDDRRDLPFLLQRLLLVSAQQKQAAQVSIKAVAEQALATGSSMRYLDINVTSRILNTHAALPQFASVLARLQCLRVGECTDCEKWAGKVLRRQEGIMNELVVCSYRTCNIAKALNATAQMYTIV